MKQTIAKIAARHLFIETLTTRRRDSLDFHDVSVQGIVSALKAAYSAGGGKPTSAKARKLFAELAAKHLFIETLDPRNRDSLDFYDVSVWGVKAALEAAYTAARK